MFVVTYRKFFYTLSGILIIGSIVATIVWGFNLGIDFKGGSILEIDYPASIQTQPPTQDKLSSAIAPLNLDASVRATGNTGFIIRMRTITPEEKTSLTTVLNSFITATNTVAMATSSNTNASTTNSINSITEKSFDSIGPVLGSEALQKALVSVIFVVLAIILFIAYAFRKVSEPISSWKYGIVAIIALIHDIIIPTGAFVFLGHFAGYEIDTLFVTAILVVLGFSVHDTIVVFDRVRENLQHASAKKPFDQIVGESISQTFTRSINTSLTTLFALIVLYFFGGESTQHFSLALIIGIFAGTYSSIFIGSPLLVTIWKWQENKKRKGKK